MSKGKDRPLPAEPGTPCRARLQSFAATSRGHVNPAPSPADRYGSRGTKLAALLIVLTTLPPISINTFLPSLPSIAEEFDTSKAVIQLGVTLFLFAFASAQLVLGPASDRFGRRPTLIAGMWVFVLGGLIVLFSTSAPMFVAGRVVQGIGAASGPALGRAIIIDIYGRAGSTRLLAYATVATALAPMVAPPIGGLLEELAGWRWVFVLLLAFSAALLAASTRWVPETNPQLDPHALQPAKMAANYRSLLRDRTFVAYALLLGLLFAGQVAFLATSSFILIDIMGLSPTVYGVTFMAIAAGVAIGATLASRLHAARLEPAVVLVGAAIAAGATIVMAGIGVVATVGLWAIIVPVFVRAFGSGLLRPAAMAGAILPFREKAGLASAVLGFGQMGIGALYGIAAGPMIGTSADALAMAIAVPTVLGFVLLVAITPKAKHREPSAPT